MSRVQRAVVGWLVATLFFSLAGFAQDGRALGDRFDLVPRDGSGDLGLHFVTTVNGGVAAGGVGLRGSGSGTISINGIPGGATVVGAYLYVATMGPNPVSSAMFGGSGVGLPLIGTSDHTCWGFLPDNFVPFNHVYRVNVTGLVNGNGNYSVSGLPSADVTTPSSLVSQGATLVVLWEQAGEPSRTVVIYDGAVALNFVGDVHTETIGSFSPGAQTELIYVVGDGQAFPSGRVRVDGVTVATDVFDGSDGDYWDTERLDVSGIVDGSPLTTTLELANDGDDCVVWAASILVVGGEDGGGGGIGDVIPSDEIQLVVDGTAPQEAVNSEGERVVVFRRSDAALVGLDAALLPRATQAPGDGVFAAFFDKNDKPKGQPVEVASGDQQRAPSVSVGDDNTFFVGWNDGQQSALKGKFFDVGGASLGPTFTVASGVGVGNPQTAVAPGGEHAVIWQEGGMMEGTGNGIFAKFFDKDGNANQPIQIDPGTPGSDPETPTVGSNSNGNVFIAWTQSVGAVEATDGLFAQFFDKNGNPTTQFTPVDTSTGDVTDPKAHRNGPGDAVVVWEKDKGLAGSEVQAQIFRNNGTKKGGIFTVNATSTGDQDEPSVAVAPNGDFVVAWTHDPPTEGNESVFARFFDKNGDPASDEITVAESTGNSSPGQPDVNIAADGTVRVTYERENNSGQSQGLFSRTFRQNPQGAWMTLDGLPDFRFKARITNSSGDVVETQKDSSCISETLCVSGAIPGRSEVFVRVVGPRPNGFLWPTLVKFTTSKVEIFAEQLSAGSVKSYVLAAARPGFDELPGLFDRTGFSLTAATSAGMVDWLEWREANPDLVPLNDPIPPSGPWLSTPQVPGFRFKARITQTDGTEIQPGREASCISETLCLSGAIPGRSELFARVVGPRPNGKLWPTLVKFTTSQVEIWIQQGGGSGQINYYLLPGASPGNDDLTGLFDREGFDP